MSIETYDTHPLMTASPEATGDHPYAPGQPISAESYRRLRTLDMWLEKHPGVADALDPNDDLRLNAGEVAPYALVLNNDEFWGVVGADSIQDAQDTIDGNVWDIPYLAFALIELDGGVIYEQRFTPQETVRHS